MMLCPLQVLLALACYAIVSFLFNLLDEVRPIFASAPIEDGGLNMTTEALAWSLSFGGVSFILYVCLGECCSSSPPCRLSRPHLLVPRLNTPPLRRLQPLLCCGGRGAVLAHRPHWRHPHSAADPHHHAVRPQQHCGPGEPVPGHGGQRRCRHQLVLGLQRAGALLHDTALFPL